jgi:hypothetical protein
LLLQMVQGRILTLLRSCGHLCGRRRAAFTPLHARNAKWRRIDLSCHSQRRNEAARNAALRALYSADPAPQIARTRLLLPVTDWLTGKKSLDQERRHTTLF